MLSSQVMERIYTDEYLYPFSKDVAQYDSLIKQVYRYRMVIGQPDQEETLRLLRERVEDGTLSEDECDGLYMNLCPFVKVSNRHLP